MKTHLRDLVSTCRTSSHTAHRFQDRERERETFIRIFTCECWTKIIRIEVCLFHVLCVLHHHIICHNIYLILCNILLLYTYYYRHLFTHILWFDSLSLMHIYIGSQNHDTHMFNHQSALSRPTLASQHCFPGLFDQGDIHTCDETAWYNSMNGFNHDSTSPSWIFFESVLAFSCGIHFHVLVLPALRNFHGPKAHPSSTPEKNPSPGAAAALWQMFQTPSWKCPGCSRYVELPAYDSLSAEKSMKNQSLVHGFFRFFKKVVWIV